MGQLGENGSIDGLVGDLTETDGDGGDEEADANTTPGDPLSQVPLVFSEAGSFDSTTIPAPVDGQLAARNIGAGMAAGPFPLDLPSFSWDHPEFYPPPPPSPYPFMGRRHSYMGYEGRNLQQYLHTGTRSSLELRRNTTTRPEEDLDNLTVYGQSNHRDPNAYFGQDNITTRVDAEGVKWMTFEYTRDRLAWTYNIRCDIDSVDESSLSKRFKEENCVYPKAMVPPEEYKGHRQRYETICNELGWRLSYLNPELMRRRGLIQRAVDSYRNSSRDISSRSRRARRLARRMARGNHSR